MKILVPKERLVQAIQLAERLVGKKESLPVLSCLLIEASEQCTIKATNLEAGIAATVPCEIKEKGVVAVPAGIFSQTIRSISGETVTLTVDENNVRVESRGTKTLIKAVSHDEFPQLGGSDKKGVSVPRESLLRAIQAVSYAASPSMIRPELGSILVGLRESCVVCAATDSFRLAEKTVTGSLPATADDILIPLKHALELSHMLERVKAETISIASDDSQLTVTADGVRFVSRVIDGSFPNYKDIIPKDSLVTATVLKSDFAEMLRKARVFAGAEMQVGFHLYPGKKIFSATAQSATVGEMSDTLDAALTGEDLDINFHIGYVGDCLGAIQSDSITLSFAGIGRPLVIRGVSDNSFIYLVMPLNR
jgi:DNA polymerase-3 subunit beta